MHLRLVFFHTLVDFKKEESEEESEEKIKDDFKSIKYIEKESKGINHDLFKECFSFSVTSALAKKLYETKNRNKNKS